MADAIGDQLWNSIERDAVGCHRDHTGHVRVHPRSWSDTGSQRVPPTLSAIFTPQDTTDYSPVAATVSLVVNGTAPLINTVAGNGTAVLRAMEARPPVRNLYGPNGVAFDTAGNMYIGDSYNNRIRKGDPGEALSAR